jgi:hypothetical protein
LAKISVFHEYVPPVNWILFAKYNMDLFNTKSSSRLMPPPVPLLWHFYLENDILALAGRSLRELLAYASQEVFHL